VGRMGWKGFVAGLCSSSQLEKKLCLENIVVVGSMNISLKEKNGNKTVRGDHSV
jgi:hypothetical protein